VALHRLRHRFAVKARFALTRGRADVTPGADGRFDRDVGAARKLGTYGLLRFRVGLFPLALVSMRPVILTSR